MKRAVPTTFILILLLSTCSNDPVLEEKETIQSGNAAISIVTLDNGTLVGSDGTIPVSLAFSDQYLRKKGSDAALSLEAVLRAPDGSQVATVAVDAIKGTDGVLPSISLPALQPGYYQLALTLKENGVKVSEKTLSFFSDSGSYKITRLSSYPLSFLPGSSGILQVFTKYPDGRDPFIRWTLDGKIVHEASASGGGSVCAWTAPAKEGVYSVKAEIFPCAPQKGTYSFTSPVFLTGQVYVSRKELQEETDFSPESRYYSLFHFRGNLNDNGTRTEKKTYGTGNLEPIGTPSLLFASDVFGYSFDGSSGFRTEQYLLPLSKGVLHPFTVRFRVLTSASPESRTWFEVKSKSGIFEFIVFTNEEGALSFELSSADRRAGGNSERRLAKNVPLVVELSISPKDGKLASSWKFDGVAGKAAAEDFTVDPVPEQGTSRLAGEKGFVGIFDEFGVVDDSVSSEPVSKILYSLTAASGADEYIRRGEVVARDGSIRLSPGAEISSPPVELADGTYTLSLKFDAFTTAEEGEVVIDLVSADGTEAYPLASLRRKGAALAVSLGEVKAEAEPASRDAVSVRLRKSKGLVELETLGVSANVAQPDQAAAMVFRVRNLKQAASQLSIQKVEISRESGPIAGTAAISGSR